MAIWSVFEVGEVWQFPPVLFSVCVSLFLSNCLEVKKVIKIAKRSKQGCWDKKDPIEKMSQLETILRRLNDSNFRKEKFQKGLKRQCNYVSERGVRVCIHSHSLAHTHNHTHSRSVAHTLTHTHRHRHTRYPGCLTLQFLNWIHMWISLP
jgi:hypothetical protein